MHHSTRACIGLVPVASVVALALISSQSVVRADTSLACTIPAGYSNPLSYMGFLVSSLKLNTDSVEMSCIDQAVARLLDSLPVCESNSWGFSYERPCRQDFKTQSFSLAVALVAYKEAIQDLYDFVESVRALDTQLWLDWQAATKARNPGLFEFKSRPFELLGHLGTARVGQLAQKKSALDVASGSWESSITNFIKYLDKIRMTSQSAKK